MFFENCCFVCKNNNAILYDFEKSNYFCDTCFNIDNKCEPVYLENCNKNFERYQWLNEFSHGAFGIIYQVYNKILNKKTLLKVQMFKNRKIIKPQDTLINKEIEISCYVSELPNFVKMLNYWICDIEPVDEIWKTSRGKETIEELWNSMEQQVFDLDKKVYIDLPKMIFYIEMEQYEGTLRDLYTNKTISDYDKFSFFFEMLYSIMNAFKQIGFNHNDVHAKNVFYMFNNEEREYKIEVKIGDSKKTKFLNIICNSIFVPIWGDFGFSRINKKEEENISELMIYMLQEWNFSYSLDTKNIKNNQILLEWLGYKVINSISNKKRKIK